MLRQKERAADPIPFISATRTAASRSEAFGANESIGEIGGDKDRDGAAQDIVECHRSLRLKPVAGARIGKAEGEKHRGCADQNNIHHRWDSFLFEEPDRKKSAVMWDVAFHSFWLRREHHPFTHRRMHPNRIKVRDGHRGNKIGIL